jgi:hypothetical protein
MKYIGYFIVLLNLIVTVQIFAQQPFTPGNIVVYRVGDGSVTFSNGVAAKVFLDEYTPSGSLVQSILMPSSAVGPKLTMAGRSNGFNSSGLLNLSTNGKYLIVPGFNADLGLRISQSATDRSVAIIDFNGIVSSITALPNSSGATGFPSATSDDGTNLWMAAGDNVEYGQVTNPLTTVIATGAGAHAVSIARGQLYVSNAAGTTLLATVGTGLPSTSGQTETGLPGYPVEPDADSYQFGFADLDAGIPGVDVLYVADQHFPSIGGIRKYSLVGGMWIANGGVGSDADAYTGLTVKVAAGVVTIFATRLGSNSSSVRGGELVTLVDNSGYNNALTGTPTVIKSVTSFGPANTVAFRGVALVPLNCAAVGALQVVNVTPSQVTLTWNSNTSANFEYAVTTSLAPPVSTASTSSLSATVNGLTNGLTYYAHVRTNCGAESGVSEWSTVKFVTGCQPPLVSLINVSISATGVITAKWNSVVGAADYEYLVTSNQSPPAFGTAISDTSITISGLNSVSHYYIHVRSKCNGGFFSDWSTKEFSTACFVPSPIVSIINKSGGIKWNKVNNALKYEYALTNTPAKPLSGAYTNDTVYTTSERTDGSNNYFHLRSICNGAVSDWTTIQFNIKGLQVYPNPLKETMYITLQGFTNGNIIIGDGMGRIVKKMQLTGSTTSVDIRSWSSGVYLVRYNDGMTSYSVKVIKQ